jgi:anti-anti-sigma factor
LDADGATTTELTITVVPGTPHLVKLLGELDLASAPELRSQLRPLDGDLEVDLAGLTFLDSSGMNALVDVHRDRDARGHRLVIRGASGIVLRALTITGLTEFFDLEP